MSLLDFDLTLATPYTFLQRISQLADICDERQAFHFAAYLCEMSLLDPKMNQFRPSLIAAASVYFTKKIMKLGQAYSPQMQQQLSYREKEIRDCVRELCIALNNVDKKPKVFGSLYRKYSSAEFDHVAIIPEQIKQQNKQSL